MSIKRWMDKDVVHIHNRILLSQKEEWNDAISSHMDRPRDYHTKWSGSERERQTLYDSTYMWNLKCDTNGEFPDSPVIRTPHSHYWRPGFNLWSGNKESTSREARPPKINYAVLCLVAQSCLTLCDPMDCSPTGSSVLGDSPGQNIGVGCHALLHRVFLTQGLNPGFPHCK